MCGRIDAGTPLRQFTISHHNCYICRRRPRKRRLSRCCAYYSAASLSIPSSLYTFVDTDAGIAPWTTLKAGLSSLSEGGGNEGGGPLDLVRAHSLVPSDILPASISIAQKR